MDERKKQRVFSTWEERLKQIYLFRKEKMKRNVLPSQYPQEAALRARHHRSVYSGLNLE